MQKIYLTSIFILLMSLSVSYAQSTSPDVIASAGGHGSNSTHQLSWTIGEPVITTQVGTSNILTQGFHQTNLTISSTFQLNESVQIQAFPNPTTQYVNISIQSNKSLDALSLKLLDITGKELHQQTLSSNDTQYQLSLENYPSGIYLVSIQNSKKQITNTYQIIKK